MNQLEIDAGNDCLKSKWKSADGKKTKGTKHLDNNRRDMEPQSGINDKNNQASQHNVHMTHPRPSRLKSSWKNIYGKQRRK